MAEEAATTPEKPAVPKAEASKTKDEPLTKDEFADRLDNLFGRARAAGVRPLQVMAATYAKQGLDILDGFLGALEEGSKKKAPTTRKRKKPVA